MQYLIRDLNKNEKPREKLLKLGSANLTEVELLALLLRSGGKATSALELARTILTKFNGLNGLTYIDLHQLLQIKYVNIAKASTIVAALELGLRITAVDTSTDLSPIQKPEDVLKVVRKEFYRKQKEHLVMLSLNSRNKLISKDLISIGTVNETMLSPREIFKQAFLRNAVAIILVHNHPSNDPTPSDEDIHITKELVELAKKIHILLLDHIIVTENSYLSMKTENLLAHTKLLKKGGDTYNKSGTKR